VGQLDGKVAIVTGATSGIGERIAEGARVVGAGRREEEGRVLEKRCGPALNFVRADVADEASVRAMVAHAVTRFGRLDCLVNIAGSGSPMVGISEVTGDPVAVVN
jgi:NAD(P)-dependent dehydrogenase (short-subunit alcohol dehydrogenase family)